MRIVVALGGNALLRRGEPMTAENQRANVRIAAGALAPIAAEHELVISHGNGPQVGLLALQGGADDALGTYPLDVLGAQTEGMIGYLIEQELGNELPFERHLATLLTMIEVDRDDPAFDVWSDTSTLFTRVLRGHVDAATEAAEDGLEILGAGVIHVQLLDFLHQLTTFQVEASGPVEGASVLADFGQFFLGRLWDVYANRILSSAPI